MQVTGTAVNSPIDKALDIEGRLEECRVEIEARFLTGGDILGQTVQSVSEMVSFLEDVMKAMDQSRVDTTMSALADTAQNLLALPEAQSERGKHLGELAAITSRMTEQVDDMLTIIRFLRSFATTVKVTGAGAEGFDAFASEMLSEITEARRQASNFHATLESLCTGIRSASKANAEVGGAYRQVVPGLAANLTADAGRFRNYYADVRNVAGELSALVRGIQSKMARALSALQVGDITRQRVEHLQAGLALLRRDREAGMELGAAETALYLRLIALQAEDLLAEFQEGCETVTSNLAGLVSDTRELLALGRKARGDSSASSDSFMEALEASVSKARSLVSQVEDTAARLGSVCNATATTARDLALSIDDIQAIETKIQHMAINTSLRCSRMGEAGKPINVVATELRIIAGQMETVSGHLLTTLHALEEKSVALAQPAGGGLGEQLDEALLSIREAGGKIAGDLNRLSERGDAIARKVGRDVSTLDFARGIGDVLEECTAQLDACSTEADAPEESIEEPSEDLLRLADTLYAAYTMAREREVHGQVFAPPVASATPAPAAADDDLDAAFF